jgi:hypothetical protein
MKKKLLLRLPGDAAKPQPEELRHRALASSPNEFNSDIKVVCDYSLPPRPPDAAGAGRPGCGVHSATKYLNGQGTDRGFCRGKKRTYQGVKLVRPEGYVRRDPGPIRACSSCACLKFAGAPRKAALRESRENSGLSHPQPQGRKVILSGLESNPGHDIAKKQMKGFWRHVSFDIVGGKAAGISS